MTAPVIAMTDLRHQYGDTTVLDLPRLIIPPGTTAVLGPNGAGKTTLLRIIATTLAPGHGTVMIDGRDAHDVAHQHDVRASLGFAMQSDRLPERMRVGEFCDYIAALNEIGPRRRRMRWVSWALNELGLSEVQGDRISTLSGGMRRRLVIAQAFIGQPTLMILDEPLVSLDATHRANLVRSIATSADERTSVVATHHGDELGAICRNVVVLHAGRLAFSGPPGELAQRAEGRVWECSTPIDHDTARAVGPDRFRVVDHEPATAQRVEPTVHDGYLAVVNDAQAPAQRF